jgi:hypothetical protein
VKKMKYLILNNMSLIKLQEAKLQLDGSMMFHREGVWSLLVRANETDCATEYKIPSQYYGKTYYAWGYVYPARYKSITDIMRYNILTGKTNVMFEQKPMKFMQDLAHEIESGNARLSRLSPLYPCAFDYDLRNETIQAEELYLTGENYLAWQHSEAGRTYISITCDEELLLSVSLAIPDIAETSAEFTDKYIRILDKVWMVLEAEECFICSFPTANPRSLKCGHSGYHQYCIR